MFSDLISALDVHTGKVIVNWSLSSHPGEAVPRHFDGILTAILDAYPELIVVAAAGNDDSNNPKIRPGGFAHPRFISVGATRQEEHWPNGVPVKAIFSNYGHWVQCWTIGENIVAPYLNGTVAYFDAAGAPKVEVFDQSPSYAKWSGTSFAAPIVAAKIAVEYSKTWMTAEAAIDAVLSSAQRVVLGNRANSAFVDPR